MAGDTVLSGNLYLGGRIYNEGDNNTYFRPRSDRWQLYAGGLEVFDADNSASQKQIVFNGGRENIDFRVKSDNINDAIKVDASADRVLILSGGSPTSFNFAEASDVSFFVSGTVGSFNRPVLNTQGRGVSVFGGDTYISGTLIVSGGQATGYGSISGSIFQTATGLSYIRAGTNITVASGSNGQVTISSTAGGGGAVENYTNNGNNRIITSVDSDTINGEANLTFDGSIFTVTGDSTLNGSVTINEAGADKDFRVESNNKSHAVFVDGGTDQVLVLSGGHGTSYNEAGGSDVNFYVSGSRASKGTPVRGTSLFGGDVAVSGTMNMGTVKVQASMHMSDFTYGSQNGTFLMINTSGGPVTGTLPGSGLIGGGHVLIFKDIGGFAGNSGKGILIKPGSGERIDGALGGVKIQVNSGSLQLISDGFDSWFIVGRS